MAKQHVATLAWVGLFVYVAAYDSWALLREAETLSAAFGRGMRHHHARWPVFMLWAVVTGHLFGLLPRRLDPFHGYANIFPRVLAIRTHKSLTSPSVIISIPT